MERLRIVLIIAAMVATARTSPGQQASQSSFAGAAANHAQPTFVVIGDVRNHNYFPLTQNSRITIQQAVIQAGMFGQTVSVSVVRGKQQRAAFTQNISATSTDTGELVMEGDILVVQSMEPVHEAHEKNAALRTDGGVVPVTLADDYIAVGDVLQGTGGLPSSDQQVKVSCRFRGRPLLENAALSDRVEHGDVITVVHRAQSTSRGFGNMVPAFSEWQTSEVTQPAPAGLNAEENVVPEVAPATPLEFPVQASEPTKPSDSRNPFADPTEPAGDAALNSHSETEQSGSELTVRSVSQAAALPPEPAESIAPTAPVEIAVPLEAARQTPAASMGLWNILFIGGLLVAGSMILIGSLRSEDEDFSSDGAMMRSAAISGNAVNSVAQTASPSIEPMTMLDPVVPEKKTLAPARPADIATEVPSKPPLASENLPSATETQAWFGGDWRNTTSKASVASMAPEQAAACDSVIVAAGMDHRGQVDAPSIYLMEKMVVESLGDSKARSVDTAEKITAEKVAAPAVPSIKLIAEKVAVELELPSSVPIRPAMTDSAVNNGAKVLSDLEDLLQNRLPIDLCQVELPLRVSLFGRPAGPRRLRIDATHSRVPAPHMNMSSERRRDEAVTVSAQRSGFEMPSQEEQAGEKKSTATSASLDRALHYLQDRTDT
ncbi:MAG: hypothetical protein U0936_08490 [Planctomycetaceae bacterium]